MIPRHLHHGAGWLLLQEADCPEAWELFHEAVSRAVGEVDPDTLGPVALRMWQEAQSEAEAWEAWGRMDSDSPAD